MQKKNIVQGEKNNRIFQKSQKGFLWEQKTYNFEIKQKLTKDYGDFISQIVAMRHDSIDETQFFLKPAIRDLMPDPFTILDMQKGAEFIADAIVKKKRIAIFGDYDVDGATSSAVLKRFLEYYEIDAKIYIPDRILEGYGPNFAALRQLHDEGYDLVITVDCGTTAIAPLEEAAQLGLDIIVVDHHISNNVKPKAIAIINPNRDDDDSDLGYLCGVGVCFMMLVAVNRILRSQGFYKEVSKDEFNLLNLLDLVALGTVCDCVPLIKLNRAFVAQGLKKIKQQNNLGIRHLIDISGISASKIETFHLGFMLGPRINAAGRVGKSSLGSELLASSKEDNLQDISLKLEIHNKERKAIEANVLAEAEEMVLRDNLAAEPVIIAAGEHWHPGVIGIIASRIKEKFQKPTMIIALDGQNGKASCRSLADINIGEIIIAAKEQGIITEGGGHKMAAGFSIAESQIIKLREFIRENYQAEIDKQLAEQRLWFDYLCSLERVNSDLFQEIQTLQPYGMGNEEPVFIFDNLRVIKAMPLGSDHLKLIIAESAMGKLGKSYEAISWRSLQSDFGIALLSSVGKNIAIAGTIKENIWQDMVKYQITIIDAIIA